MLVWIIWNFKGASYETLCKRCLKKIGCHRDLVSVLDPFNGYHEMRHNSAVARQNQLEFWNQKEKQIFS